MASKGLSRPVAGIISQLTRNGLAHEPITRSVTPQLTRSMATETTLSPPTTPQAYSSTLTTSASLNNTVPPHIQSPTVLTTVYSFPQMEPLRFAQYPSNHLNLPLRRDLLHRAVVYEGDMTRLGTASTKWRSEIHGSAKKIRPQKGTGRARLGDKKSPMLRGGGVAFGPKPRDFSTELPRKMYDLAWRTALSYRYARGELVVVEDRAHFPADMNARMAREIFSQNGWGNKDGRSLIITEDLNKKMADIMEQIGRHGRLLDREDVDVKDLLEMGRIIVEKSVLDRMFADHESDLGGAKVPMTMKRPVNAIGA